VQLRKNSGRAAEIDKIKLFCVFFEVKAICNLKSPPPWCYCVRNWRIECRKARSVSTAVRRNKHYLACRAGGATKGANASHPGIRSDIAPLSGGFAEEQRQERTCVRDWSGDDCKASGSKRDRSVNSFPAGPVYSGSAVAAKFRIRIGDIPRFFRCNVPVGIQDVDMFIVPGVGRTRIAGSSVKIIFFV